MGADRHRIEQGLDAADRRGEGDACGGDVEPPGAIASQAGPVHEPAEAALHHPAALEHDEALLGGVALDHAAAHAMEVAPRLAAFGDEGAVQDRLAQARPGSLARRQRVQAVPVLHVRGHHRHGEPGAVRVHQGDALAPEHLLGGVIAAGAAHGDAFDGLGVDDGQPWWPRPPGGTPAQPGDPTQERVDRPHVQPAPQPAVDRPPGRESARESPPRAPCPQVPDQPRHHRAERGPARALPGRIRPLQPSRHLPDPGQRHHLLDAGGVPCPMLLRPHPSLTPPRQADPVLRTGFRWECGSGGALTQTGSQPRAGRLDLLLQDPETKRRYEVELQLGATDEAHIIRTIEYWDIERKRYPQYDHCAVLIAEDITSRFLNVVALFNGTIPLMAIQVQALKVADRITV